MLPNAKKYGLVSFALFLFQLLGITLAILVGQVVDPSGHPPLGIALLLLAALGILFLSPVGLVLGLAGGPRTYGKSLTGLVGNAALFLLVLALWCMR